MRRIGWIVLVLAIGAGEDVWAWTSRGHRLITRATVDVLAGTEVAWLGSLADSIEEASVQPDLMRPRELPTLRAAEAPRHYLDLEVLGGRELPPDYFEYLRLLGEIAESGKGGALLRPGGDVSQVGTLPYAIVEGTQRLAAMFAQLRVRPDDRVLRSMAALQSGFVAHYAQDLCQPLHTSIHHDGRAGRDLSSPHSGIHRRVDDLPGRLALTPVDGHRPERLEPLFPAVYEALMESHSLVDRVYELAPAIESLQRGGAPATEVVAFAQQRFDQAVGLTADLILTAWMESKRIEVPPWAVQGTASTQSPDGSNPSAAGVN